VDAFPRFDLEGRVALVTGAARGLGRAIALALANAGADVAVGLHDVSTEAAGGRDPGGAEHAGDGNSPIIVDEIRALGREALAVQMDVLDLGQIRDAVAAVVDRFGRLDILINNAGVSPSDLAEEVREDNFDLTMNVNVKGVFFASQAAGRQMIRQGFGRIVSLSSQAGFIALPTESVYCMSKAAVAHLTKCLAVEWGGHGITVNAVAPTFIRTPGTEEALADPVFKAEVLERIAGVHRIGEPMDVAGAVVFLASPAAAMITGTTLMIDGGWTAR
jgi:NAD(P)-dependent dehydrogenase (short-subunit alcohol dehydrogenase family)